MTPRPFALERFFAHHEFTARYLLCSSDPESMSVGDLLAYEPDPAAAATELQGLWLGYTETWGHPQLRESIAALYEPTLGARSVLVHSGAEEPIFIFMNVALSRGDHLITHFPCYQSHYALAESLGVSVSRWKARSEAGWLPDPDELAGLIRPETRAVILSFPHNPTGALLDRARLEAVVALCRRHGLWLFSDEVYRGLEHDPARRLPAAADLYERAISLGAMPRCTAWRDCALAG